MSTYHLRAFTSSEAGREIDSDWLRLAIVENSQRLRQAVRQIDKCLNRIA